jgi:hypothetical protein
MLIYSPEPAGEACLTVRTCCAGSKQAILIDHLAKGATLAELVAALKPWSESSVKSALYWDVAKVNAPILACGYRVARSGAIIAARQCSNTLAYPILCRKAPEPRGEEKSLP